MKISLSFLGAVQNITGSRHLLKVDGTSILVDCGLYQERQFKDRNWDPFPINPETIDAVFLTHAHLDHCGLLPKLVKEGFKGKIYCTQATAEIAQIILFDAAHIQEEDAEHKKRRHKKKGHKPPREVKPLYTTEDVQQCLPLFETVEYRKSITISDTVETTFYDAGHVLGSAIIRVKVRKSGQERIIIFSGDIGRPGRPIVCDPTVFDTADYVIIESTYGDRLHKEVVDIKTNIAQVINDTIKAGGNIIVPSFALERSQEMLYYLNKLLQDNDIPHFKIFLDSPMASKITKIFKQHAELFDPEMTEFVNSHHSPFKLADLQLAGKAEQSKAINNINEPVMIIAGSGMCTGGRVKYHLINNITNPKNTVMFIGYQAIGTLGRLITDGAKKIRILGEQYKVKAKIVRIHGFSSHADQQELFNWLNELKTPPKEVFVVHGEKNSSEAFAEFIKRKTGWNVTVPEFEQEITVEEIN
ncbi:MAG: MBL fold metallo-hydrolase [Planctomycetes bacterium]|nr:MBL fold metallo-hydrolase [Planctomycetota bacterium]